MKTTKRVVVRLYAALERDPGRGVPYLPLVHDIERALIERVLAHTNGNVLRAAILLGVKRDKLRYRIKVLKIRFKRNPAGRPAEAA